MRYACIFRFQPWKPNNIFYQSFKGAVPAKKVSLLLRSKPSTCIYLGGEDTPVMWTQTVTEQGNQEKKKKRHEMLLILEAICD